MRPVLHSKHFGSGPELVILHGLFGSLDNWQSLAKKIAEEGFSVWIVDQRNHGRSFHSDTMNYTAMADDLLHFLEVNRLEKIILCGHSMGGKTAMAFSLQHPEKVRQLMVCDISPAAFEDRHHEVFDALNAIPVETLQNREEADILLSTKGIDTSTRQFLLKNLYRDENGQFHWRFNLPVLHAHYNDIADEIKGKPVSLPTLFIKGQLSQYINASNYPEIQHLFPLHQLCEIPGAGHWVHAEQPELFLKSLLHFISHKQLKKTD
jgi:esterase